MITIDSPMGPGFFIFFNDIIVESHGGGGPSEGVTRKTPYKAPSRQIPREIRLPDEIDPIVDMDQLLLEDDELLLLVIKAIESGTI